MIPLGVSQLHDLEIPECWRYFHIQLRLLFLYVFCLHFEVRISYLPNPHPPTFFTEKIFEFFFMDIWVSGQRVGKLTVWQS